MREKTPRIRNCHESNLRLNVATRRDIVGTKCTLSDSRRVPVDVAVEDVAVAEDAGDAGDAVPVEDVVADDVVAEDVVANDVAIRNEGILFALVHKFPMTANNAFWEERNARMHRAEAHRKNGVSASRLNEIQKIEKRETEKSET